MVVRYQTIKIIMEIRSFLHLSISIIVVRRGRKCPHGRPKHSLHSSLISKPFPSRQLISVTTTTSTFFVLQLWSSETGKCYHTFRGHTAEIVCVSFNPQSTLVATGSMDTTAKLWSVQTGTEVCTLAVSQIQYNNYNPKSFNFDVYSVSVYGNGRQPSCAL